MFSYSLILLVTAVLATSCGSRTSSTQSGTGPEPWHVPCGNPALTMCSIAKPEPMPGPEPHRDDRHTSGGTLGGIAFTEGALSLVPDNFGIEGVVHYRIFETGLVVYQGSVSYFGSLISLGGGKVFRQTFQGSYRAKPETVSVKTFWNRGHTFSDYKTNFEVGPQHDSSIVVTAAAPSEGATATFEIDGLVHPIALRRAEIKGKVFGIDVTITAVPVELDEILANQ